MNTKTYPSRSAKRLAERKASKQKHMISVGILAGFLATMIPASAVAAPTLVNPDGTYSVVAQDIGTSFEAVDAGNLPNMAGFRHNLIENGNVPAGTDLSTIQIKSLGTSGTDDSHWANYWILNSPSASNGEVAVAEGLFLWGGNRNVGRLPDQTIRYQNALGDWVEVVLSFTKEVNPNIAPTASPNTGTVKAGETIRTPILSDDYAGLDSTWNFNAFMRGQSVVLQDPADNQWKKEVTVDGVGTYEVVIDNSAFLVENPDFYEGEYSTAEQNRMTAGSTFVDFTSVATFEGTTPELNYRFSNGSSAGGGGGEGTVPSTTVEPRVIGEVNISESFEYIETSDQPQITDYLTIGHCIDPSKYSATITPEPGQNPDDFLIEITDTDAPEWFQSVGGQGATYLANGVEMAYVLGQGVEKEIAPSMTVLGQSEGTLSFNYHSEGIVGVELLLTPCDFAYGAPAVAVSNVSYNVLGEPVVVPPVEPPVVTPPVEPPVTEPPVTEPPVTPPVVEPPIEEPPATTPPVVEPPIEEPPATTPPVVEPPVEEPPAITPPVDIVLPPETPEIPPVVEITPPGVDTSTGIEDEVVEDSAGMSDEVIEESAATGSSLFGVLGAGALGLLVLVGGFLGFKARKPEVATVESSSDN